MKKKFIPIIAGVVFIILLIIIIIPSDYFENLGKQEKEIEQSTLEVDTSESDLESINDKIAKDNELRGDSGEEISTEGVSETPVAVENASQVTAPNMYVERETAIVVDELVDFAKNINPNDIDFKFTFDVEYKGSTTGKNANLDKVKSILGEGNYGYKVIFTDLVYITQLEEGVFVCKLSPNCNDLVVVKCYSDIYDITDTSSKTGDFCTLGFYIENMYIQKYNGKEILVASYGY